MGALGHISLRGVEVHNLDAIDVDIPHRKLVVLCGLSGSGKSSLALDTLYAEGQRRYIESFSAYTRQFLQRLEKPAAERIDGIPPAIAVTGKNASRSSRSTVGTATETSDHLRLLFARIGQVFCRQCGEEVRRDSPQSTAEMLQRLPAGTRYVIAFRPAPAEGESADRLAAALIEDGFLRVIQGERLVNLAEEPATELSAAASGANGLYVVVDRLTAAGAGDDRVRDSLETAFHKGHGRCYAIVEEPAANGSRGTACMIDGRAGAAWASAPDWPARIAASSTLPSSLDCSASTARSAPARSARASAT